MLLRRIILPSARAAGVLMLVGSSACGWPPFPGSAGFADICPNASWSDVIAGYRSPAGLNSVFVTTNAIWAVGESGLVVTIQSGSAQECYLRSNSLKSVLVSGNKVFIAGGDGIFETQTTTPCKPDVPVVTASCTDLWQEGDALFAACSADVKFKSMQSGSWSPTVPVAAKRYNTVVSGGGRLVAGSTLKQSYSTLLPPVTWTPFATRSSELTDGWFDGQSTSYLVGSAGELLRFDAGSGTATDISSQLDTIAMGAEPRSIWGIGQKLYVVGLSAGAGSTGFVWESQQRSILAESGVGYLSVHGTPRGVYIVGSQSGASTTGIIRCKSL